MQNLNSTKQDSHREYAREILPEKITESDWGADSVVNSAYHSCREPMFSSQHLHGLQTHNQVQI